MSDEVKCRKVKAAPIGTVVVMLVIPMLIWVIAWLAHVDIGLLRIGKLGTANAFLLVIGLLTAFCFVVGRAVTGLWRGLLIDDRNWISLSRLQTVMWTVVVVSAILVAAFGNIAAAPDQENPLKEGPLDFRIPEEIWLALGISVTSLIGSPLIRSTKKERPPNQDELNRTMEAFKAQGDTSMSNQGQLLTWKCPEHARWGDLFRAEEVGNGAHLDLGKVQNFYFTLILVLAYAQALFALFASHDTTRHLITDFPGMSGGMAALMAISHGAYLANKARPQSQPGSAGG